MSPQKTHRVRQYALPGCCHEMPITLDGDEQTAPNTTRPKPISNHTATWLGELARGRQDGRVNRPAIEAAQAQGCRKRAVLEVDEDNDEPRNGGAKRLRLSGDNSYPTRQTSHIVNRPFHQNNRHHLSQPYNEKVEDTLAELEVDLRAKQRRIDEERVVNREIRVREEQARLRDEEERARAAELREQQNRSIFRSNLHAMWQDYDHDRKAADERLKGMEREQREKVHKKEREAEEKRRGELNSIEANIKSMWDADDLDATGSRKIRPGQLSEAGQRRVRERQERLRRQGM